jgi:hypothetical protein
VVGAVEVLIPQYRAKIDVVLPKVEEAAAQLSAALGATKASLGSAVEKEVVPAQPSQPQIPTAQTPPAGIGSPLTARTTK